tara:strand:- start:915 stop:1232 length:318 start_codon:yes stop_codon:yes gene_type:complete
MAIDHKGLGQFTGLEASNISLGQSGFKLLTNTTLSTGDGHFVAFKVIGSSSAANLNVNATTWVGDDLIVNDVLTGEMVYGPFKNITISSLSTTTLRVICYYGKEG